MLRGEKTDGQCIHTEGLCAMGTLTYVLWLGKATSLYRTTLSRHVQFIIDFIGGKYAETKIKCVKQDVRHPGSITNFGQHAVSLVFSFSN